MTRMKILTIIVIITVGRIYEFKKLL